MIKFLIDNFVWIAGLATGAKWVFEYTQTRKFEKNKFLLDRIEKFYELNSVKQVNILLDWNAIKIDIEGQMVAISDRKLCQALVTHDQRSEFEPHEVYLRKIFDEYFDELNELIILSQCGLIDRENLKKFLSYWLRILNGSRKVKPQEFSKTIHDYLTFYEYHEVKKLIF